jgi:tetratricopeptide (TPR) repeat protein
LGLKDISILEEIGDLYHGLLELDQALIAYKMLATIDPEYPEGLKKYAEVLEDPRCRDQNIDRAIDYYKKCLNLINGDANKTDIASRMETLYKKMGREHEIREIQQYLNQDRLSG